MSSPGNQPRTISRWVLDIPPEVATILTRGGKKWELVCSIREFGVTASAQGSGILQPDKRNQKIRNRAGKLKSGFVSNRKETAAVQPPRAKDPGFAPRTQPKSVKHAKPAKAGKPAARKPGKPGKPAKHSKVAHVAQKQPRTQLAKAGVPKVSNAVPKAPREALASVPNASIIGPAEIPWYVANQLG